MKRTFLTAAICLLAACTDGGQQPGAPLNASRNGEAAFEATEGTTVRLEEYLHVTGGVPPYGYATSLQGDFAPSLERTVPAPEHSPAEYGVYVCDSRGNRTESPVVVSLKILPADGERTPAFPGAEGGGRYVTGGRGGRVYYVTNLLDAYPVPPEGSLRWALTQPGPKIVMFKVSGVIPLAAKLHIRNDGRYAGQGCDITVAGETAPGDGICLKNWPLAITYAENVIVRFLRFRLGDDLDTGSAQDACEGQSSIGVILDHCSMSWSVDECASFYRNRDFTLQWCILTESLRLSTHEKESPHGYGGIWGGKNASFHHNLLANHDSRNARIDHPGVYGSYLSTHRGNVDYRNNVIYNWGSNTTYGGEDGSFNVVNNYYKPGPASKEKRYFVDAYWHNSSSNVGSAYPRLYMSGNYHAGSYASSINGDQWSGVYYHPQGNDPSTTEGRLAAPLPIKAGGVTVCHTTTHTAAGAFDAVLSYAGASLCRDAVDRRAETDARSGRATFPDGGNGSTGGIIDSQAAVGGWPELTATAGEIARAAVDTDGDGIPDHYEELLGLDPKDASDAAATTLDPQKLYSNIEVYLHYLVRDITLSQVKGGSYTALQ